MQTISVFICLHISCQLSLTLYKVDIGTAYLEADLPEDEDVYMKIAGKLGQIFVAICPQYKSFVNEKGEVLVKLKKALYGLRQSAKLWNDLFSNFILSLNFIRHPLDPCVFIHKNNNILCLILVHVDDSLILCNDSVFATTVITAMRNRFTKIKVETGKYFDYLGMGMNINEDGSITLKMDDYINKVLLKSKSTGESPTPAAANLFEIDPSAELLSDPDREFFHSIVATLLYLSKRVRPDIQLPVNFLCTRVRVPNAEDMKKLQRILKYLRQTKDLGLTINKTGKMAVELYIDASFAVHSDLKSQTGAIVVVGGTTVEAKSVKQKTIGKSSTESEINALSDMAGLGIWTSNFIAEFDIECELTIYEDNMAVIALIETGRPVSDRSKHLSIRSFWLTEQIENNILRLTHLSTDLMLADMLTKPLQGATFLRLRDQLLGVSNASITL